MYAMLVVCLGVFGYGCYRHYQILRLGKPEQRLDNARERLKGLAVHALGQGRTLRKRLVGGSHWLFSWGFVVLFIGTTVVFIHEDLHIPIMQGQFYLWFQSLTLDLFGLGAIVGVAMALLRRYGGRRDRLYRPPDRRTILDDAMILGVMLVILVTGFIIEGARIIVTSDPWAAWSPVGLVTGQLLVGLGHDDAGLRSLHVGGWWFHLVLALAWIAYLPYSKLRHIAFSPANIYTRSLEPKGALSFVDVEKAFEQDPPAVGVGRLADLSWKDLMDGEACTECARCEEACPASRTGKSLSPMLLILNMRNHALQQSGPFMGRQLRNGQAGATAFVGEVITDEVLWDCTTCRACMEACPVFIEHVPKIVDMRRYLVMAENRFEPGLQRLFDNLEAAGNPWRLPRTDRAKWADGLEVPILGQDVSIQDVDVLYWVGCAGSYDERNQRVARSLASVLRQAGVRFATLGTQETCTGDPARRAGHEYLYQILGGENVATLNALGVKTILASCPHCFNTLKNEYPQLGGHYEVRHHAEYLAELVRDGRVKPTADVAGSVAYHDPCYLGRYNDVYDQPRQVLAAIPGVSVREIGAGHRNHAMCCGAGGAKIWFEEPSGKRVNHLRMDHIQAECPDRVAVSCPFCMIMLEDGARAKGVYEELPVLDIAELLAQGIATDTRSG
jgi:Fe-S oxidoreductase/nitrate reductase gamma subunit